MLDTLAFWWSCLGPMSRISLSVLWALAVIGPLIMKKIQPETFRLYLAYVLIIVFGITGFALWLSVQAATA